MAKADSTVRIEFSPTDRRLLQRIVKALEQGPTTRGVSLSGVSLHEIASAVNKQTKHDPELMADGKDVPVQYPGFLGNSPSGRPIETL